MKILTPSGWKVLDDLNESGSFDDFLGSWRSEGARIPRGPLKSPPTESFHSKEGFRHDIRRFTNKVGKKMSIHTIQDDLHGDHHILIDGWHATKHHKRYANM